MLSARPAGVKNGAYHSRMFDDDEGRDESRAEVAASPADRAREKADEFRVQAELIAVFEGVRKFDAELVPGLDPEVAREVQRTMGRLAKAKTPESPILPEPTATADAATLLDMPKTQGLSTNDYHIHRRPGEVMIVRWLADGQVETFYERLQAHFDVALEGCKEDERQEHGWKQDPQTQAYLEALDKVEVRMADRYLRGPIRQHNLFVLSDQSADEMNIAHLCDTVMGVPAADVVGPASAPPADDPTEQDLAWFFKLFSLRGMVEGEERMCFFAYLQKAEEGEW
jgi:hypothetical protein